MTDLSLVKRAVSMSMHAPDDWALQIVYTGKDGVRTRRIISPIRVLSEERFEALCLCREEPRSFFYDRCEDVLLVHASEVLAPVEIEVLEASVSP